jgi:hypothetical protein
MLFASYSRADRSLLDALLNDIRALGYEVWLDEQLSGGQIWWDEILTKIRECDVFLFLVTPASVDSEACLLELGYAHAMDRTVIPVQLAATSPAVIPSVVSRHQIVHYGTGDKTSMISVARALARAETGRPLPDPPPPQPALPGSYFSTLRDQLGSRDPLSLEQQLSIVHRLRTRADDSASRGEVVALLDRLRGRDELYASVAEQVDTLRAELSRAADRQAATAGMRPGRPARPLERLILVLGIVALTTGLVALVNPVYTYRDDGWVISWDDFGRHHRWQFALLLLLFLGLGALTFGRGQRARRVASALALGVALAGLLFWWWPRIEDLLLERGEATTTGPATLGPGLALSGISLGLQVIVGVLMVTAAFPLATAPAPAST